MKSSSRGGHAAAKTAPGPTPAQHGKPPAAAPAPEAAAAAPPDPAETAAADAETAAAAETGDALHSALRLQQLEAENAELRDQVLRSAAELENFRKRSLREQEQVQKFGIERLLRQLLPVLDNLERALEHAPAQAATDPLLEGVRMVAKQFTDSLASQGAVGFTAKNAPFDPQRHEALSRQPSAEHPPGTVLAEIQRGYMLHDRLLRPAQVVVAVAPD